MEDFAVKMALSAMY